jgi:hypothetical protein
MVRDAVSMRFAALLVGSGKLGVKSIDKEHQIALWLGKFQFLLQIIIQFLR